MIYKKLKINHGDKLFNSPFLNIIEIHKNDVWRKLTLFMEECSICTN